jgi:serine O-acetyltransferase
MFEQVKEDFRRHNSTLAEPALWALLTYRYGVWAWGIRFPPIRWLASKIYGLLYLLAYMATGVRIPREVKIGKGIHIVHAGNIGIHPKTIIGDYCGIMQDVVIGTTPQGKGTPVIGNNVFIGRGATILGKVTIGDNARIAANSLVVTDVPANTTAIGVPSRLIQNN